MQPALHQLGRLLPLRDAGDPIEVVVPLASRVPLLRPGRTSSAASDLSSIASIVRGFIVSRLLTVTSVGAGLLVAALLVATLLVRVELSLLGVSVVALLLRVAAAAAIATVASSGTISAATTAIATAATSAHACIKEKLHIQPRVQKPVSS